MGVWKETNKPNEVLKELMRIDGVEESYFSYGVYDLIAKIKANTMETLKEMVTRKIRALSKVRSTLTLIIVE